MEKADINIYEFEHFKKDARIAHGIFTGSAGNLVDLLNTGMGPLVFLNQVHGDAVKVLKQGHNDPDKGFEPGKQSYTADAMITDMAGVSLVIRVADCQSVMLYDPDKKIIANIHSGWRGSVKNIVGKSVDKMVSEFGCRPETILAGISPSLGPCCSEFVNYRDEIPDRLWSYKKKGKDFFDFWEMTKDQLMDKNLKKENIENMEICTKCNKDIFYSYRGEKTTQRFACVISMKP